MAARAELGQQTQDIELPPAVARELQLSTLGIEPANAGMARGQIDGAVGEAQVGQLERRLRAARQRQIGERKHRVGDRQFEVRAGLFGGQLQAQLHAIRAQLGRRDDGFVDRADRYLIEDDLLDAQLPVVDDNGLARVRGRCRPSGRLQEVRQIELAGCDASADTVDHQQHGVLAFAPGGDRVIDRDRATQGDALAAFAQPELPRLVDGLDQHLDSATPVVKTELTRHGETTGRVGSRLPIHADIKPV